MLTRFRIEVEERTAEQAVLTLTKYESALKAEEVDRWGLGDEVRSVVLAGQVVAGERVEQKQLDSATDLLLGRELVEEVIEYDESLPGYKARRVVRLARLDTRNPEVYSMVEGWVPPRVVDVVG